MLTIVVVVILVLLLVGGLPHWPYSAGWGYGYYPSGLFFVLIVIVLALIAAGRL
jgi:hypothetical protein